MRQRRPTTKLICSRAADLLRTDQQRVNPASQDNLDLKHYLIQSRSSQQLHRQKDPQQNRPQVSRPPPLRASPVLQDAQSQRRCRRQTQSRHQCHQQRAIPDRREDRRLTVSAPPPVAPAVETPGIRASAVRYAGPVGTPSAPSGSVPTTHCPAHPAPTTATPTSPALRIPLPQLLIKHSRLNSIAQCRTLRRRQPNRLFLPRNHRHHSAAHQLLTHRRPRLCLKCRPRHRRHKHQ